MEGEIVRCISWAQGLVEGAEYVVVREIRSGIGVLLRVKALNAQAVPFGVDYWDWRFEATGRRVAP